MTQKREQAWRTRHSQRASTGSTAGAVSSPMEDSGVMERLRPYFEKSIPGHDHWPPRENYYEHYALWSALTKPTSYLEIGVLRGWSVMAVLLGWSTIKEIGLIDNEMYGLTLEEAVGDIRRFRDEMHMKGKLKIECLNADSKNLMSIPFAGEYDLVHIDGEHSERAVRHDLELVLPKLTTRGLIIVDDQGGMPQVKAGTDSFLKDHPELESVHVKTYTGHRLIWWSPLERR